MGELRLIGRPASPGLALSRLFVLGDDLNGKAVARPVGDPASEARRLRGAIAGAISQLEEVSRQAAAVAQEMLEFQIEMLGDEALAEGAFAAIADGEGADFLAQTEPYDAVVLDLGLPKLDGLSVLEQWRAGGTRLPVLVLTARGRWHEKLAGFNAGADDYLTKPFEMEEVVVRLRALIRRASGHAAPILDCGPLRQDVNAGRFTLDGAPLELTAQEYRILGYLMHHKNRIVSRTELYEHVYEADAERDSNVLDVLVSRIRRKVGAQRITTVRGRGFLLTCEAPDCG